ncbi:mechanosensitive ion channel family protein [candidate division KSB1 bacterium]|nr:mechanosensitive ion channel family protein [candidate division KSB1 bacterium]
MDFQNFLSTSGMPFLKAGLKILIIMIIALIAMKSVKLILFRFFTIVEKRKIDQEYMKRADTLRSVIRHLLNVIIMAVAIIMILGQVGIQVGPILAAAGIVGLAVGFGAQSLVKDVINGFFILLEDQIRVGDVVNIAGKGGVVEKVNLKMTSLRDLAGNVHFIPNGNIDVVTNMTKEYSRYVFNVGVAYRENVDEVMDVIKQVGEDLQNDNEFKNDIIAPVEVLGLDEFADSALVIKARITTKPIQQWRIGREFNRRLKIVFDKKNIEIPFPHLTVYMGEDKNGNSPPINVKIHKSHYDRNIQ